MYAKNAIKTSTIIPNTATTIPMVTPIMIIVFVDDSSLSIAVEARTKKIWTIILPEMLVLLAGMVCDEVEREIDVAWKLYKQVNSFVLCELLI